MEGSINANKNPQSLMLIIVMLLLRENTNKVLMTSSHKKEMKEMKGDLKGEKKTSKQYRFKHAKMVFIQWWRWVK
jgi:hypothetical protein